MHFFTDGVAVFFFMLVDPIDSCHTSILLTVLQLLCRRSYRQLLVDPIDVLLVNRTTNVLFVRTTSSSFPLSNDPRSFPSSVSIVVDINTFHPSAHSGWLVLETSNVLFVLIRDLRVLHTCRHLSVSVLHFHRHATADPPIDNQSSVPIIPLTLGTKPTFMDHLSPGTMSLRLTLPSLALSHPSQGITSIK